MPTAVTRFEVELPFADQGTPLDTAVNNFKTAMALLTPLFQFNVYRANTDGSRSQSNFASGYLLPSQTAQALINLNALNTALVAAGLTAVLASSWQVNLQP